MTGNVPSNYVPPPDYSIVMAAQQDAADAAREVNENAERMARAIGHYAVQGTMQPR